MPRKNALICLLVSCFVFSAFAQEQGEKVLIGETKVVHSSVLNEDRNVHVFLPEGYSQSTKLYPVLYALYSEAPDYHFNTGVVAGLSRLRLVPPMITVAFDLGDGMRDLTPTKSPDYGPTSGGASNFLKYIKDELIPFVEKNYRTSSERLFWSHSIGGLFGLYALLKEPDVFQSMLVSSPYFVYDRGERYIIKNTKTFLENRNGQENFLYICVGNEPQLVPEIEAFLKILDEAKPQGLRWKYVKMPEESHMSILARSLTECLRAYGSK
jgi:predicted alpha/beta superfamily hydrolase